MQEKEYETFLVWLFVYYVVHVGNEIVGGVRVRYPCIRP
jgi:hypothetical protein